jgi:hypothetical protein
VISLALFLASYGPQWPGGWVDRVTCREVQGWAADAGQPRRIQWVEIEIDKKTYGSYEASDYRKDLDDNLSFGQGEYGFTIPLPAVWRDQRRHHLKVKVAGTSHYLYGEVTMACSTGLEVEGVIEYPRVK